MLAPCFPDRNNCWYLWDMILHAIATSLPCSERQGRAALWSRRHELHLAVMALRQRSSTWVWIAPEYLLRAGVRFLWLTWCSTTAGCLLLPHVGLSLLGGPQHPRTCECKPQSVCGLCWRDGGAEREDLRILLSLRSRYWSGLESHPSLPAAMQVGCVSKETQKKKKHNPMQGS